MSEIPTEWERYKFETEAGLREREVKISHDRLIIEGRRNVMLGMLVPIVVALMTAVPAYINSINQQNLQQSTFEANLITESVRTGDPDQAATNLKFLVEAGLLSGKTADRVGRYLETRVPGEGRVLPAD
ncbi:hypothetical protein [Candidatus Rhodobacter oscarellae]|uniref:hypothetical protein n=1 Tax=Candidatus Rhodobacter oscarellae TaxID=1675527 RepID=UPI00128EFBD6|nr:hypothetical protein [Candidatus Rhodobacter lobularis]